MIKKGDISVNFFIGVVLVLIGMVILFLIVSKFFWKGTVDNEACHQSVIFRASVPNLATSYVPLKCQTEKICITAKLFGGKCKDYGDLKGITYVRVSNLDQVQKALAENTVNCWSMLGEGKVGLFSQYVAKNYGLGSVYPTCIICSRIAFDSDSLRDSKIDLSKMDMMKYMQTHAIQGEDISYYDYLAGDSSGAKLAVNEQLLFPVITELKDENGNIIGYTKNGTNTILVDQLTEEEIMQEIERQRNNVTLQNHELSILFMQISAPKYGESLLNILKTGLYGGAAAGVLAPSKTFKVVRSVSAVCTKNPYVAVACGAVLVAAGVYQVNSVAANRAISASACGDVSVGAEARDGCSVVRIENYDKDSIKQYCSVIESIS